MPTYSGLSFAFLFFFAALPYAWMGLYAWRKRPAVAVAPFAWMMLSLSIWSLMYGLEVVLPTVEEKLVAVWVKYIGALSLPALFLLFALEFSGRSHWINARARFAVWIVPVFMWVGVCTNEFHHGMWEIHDLHSKLGATLLHVEYKPLFLALSAVLFFMALASLFLLALEAFQHNKANCIVSALYMVGFLLPLANMLYVTFQNSGQLDLTPLEALPVSFGLSWAVTRRYRLMELLPPEYLSALKNMQEGVIIANAQQRVIYLNPVAETLLGRSQHESMGQPLNHVSPLYGEKLASYLNGGEQRVNIAFDEHGRQRVFEVTISPVSSLNQDAAPGGFERMIVLHDITHLKEAESALSRREMVMSALSLAAQQLLKETTWEHNIPAVLEKIGLAAGLSRVFVAVNYEGESGQIFSSLCYEWASPSAKSQIHNPLLQHVPLREAGMERWEKLLSTGAPIFGAVKRFPASERGLLEEIGSMSLAVMPIFVNQKWWGFIMFDECRSERQWTSAEVEALNIAASMFGSAEERARAEQKLRRRQDALNLLHELVLASLQAEDLILMAQSLVKLFPKLIRADGCSLTLWDEEARQEVLLAMSDRQQRNLPSPLQTTAAEQTMTEYVLENMRPLILERAEESFFREQHIAKGLTAKSLLALPLKAGAKKIGAVTLWFNAPRRFQPDEIAISEQASNVAALALEKFRAFEEAQRRATASEKLQKASAALSATMKTEEAVTRTLEQLKQVIPYDSASVQILYEDHLQIVGGSGFADLKAVEGMSFPVPGDNPNSVVIETGKPYLMDEARTHYEAFNYPPHNHIRSWLGIPLIYQERVIGLLAVDSSQPSKFTEEDIQLASMFANQVAVTLENARIFRETQNLAITDALTGIYNRRGLFQVGDFEILRARRLNRPFSLLMFDIDHFKRVNDRYGHLAGDQILRGLADLCRANSRSIDTLCRYGGEEFVMFLPDTPLESAQRFAERVRLSVMNTALPTDEGPLRITVSIGVAQLNRSDTLKLLIERADHALYTSKRNGRNLVSAHYGTTQPLSQT